MRPKRLELQGFTSFRESTEISFEDVNLFTLSGPTGAGKSSLIDALTFALYGSVPRYENRNLVAPAISQGAEEMRVRLDFEVDGKAYTAARVVRRTRNGATTAEARLESNGQVLAGNAEELTAKVTQLLGLSFEHFTKCAVLPQGEFARFLHESASKRQDLLVELLELQVYQEMSQRAQSLYSRLNDEIRASEEILNEVYAGVSKQTLAQSKERVKDLEACRKSLQALHGPLAEAAREVEESRRSLELLQNEKTALEVIEFPEELADLSSSLEESKQQVQELSGKLNALQQELNGTREELQRLPEKSRLEQTIQLRRLIAETGSEIERLSRQRQEREGAKQKALSLLTDSENELKALRLELQAARDQNRAASLVHTLEPGQPCPVCRQVVKELPEEPPPPEISRIQSQIREVEERHEKHTLERDQIGSAVARLQVQLENQQQQKSRWESQIRELPDPESAPAQLVRRKELEAVAGKLGSSLDEERAELVRQRSKLEQLSSVESKAWQDYHRLQGRLEPWNPPAGDASKGILHCWTRLREWQEERSRTLQEKESDLTSTIDRQESRRADLEKQIHELCNRHGLDTSNQDAATACSLALAEARSEHSRIQETLQKSRELQKQVKEKKKRADTARELAILLHSGNFERWYLNRALQKLAQGASRILRQLTRDQYSLAVDERSNFEVLDHSNAYERRLAKTLSGGETFLASLALALALSEHVTELSVRGAAPLEALFLDEGFGTLDEETLEVVADALEELGAGGRMVGIISHVPELARRTPVRFEVSKVEGCSKVERIEN